MSGALLGQAVKPLADREVRGYHCQHCGRRFVWNYVRHKRVAVMPSHIDPYTATWCEKSGGPL